jgi:hypothetical protein
MVCLSANSNLHKDECTKAMVTMGKTERGGKTVTGISAVVGIIGLFESAKEDINIAIQESLLLSATKLLAKLAKYGFLSFFLLYFNYISKMKLKR